MITKHFSSDIGDFKLLLMLLLMMTMMMEIWTIFFAKTTNKLVIGIIFLGFNLAILVELLSFRLYIRFSVDADDAVDDNDDDDRYESDQYFAAMKMTTKLNWSLCQSSSASTEENKNIQLHFLEINEWLSKPGQLSMVYHHFYFSVNILANWNQS